MASRNPGEFVEFTFTEQFGPVDIDLYLTQSCDFGVAKVLVNGKVIVDAIDLYAPKPKVTEALALGIPVRGGTSLDLVRVYSIIMSAKSVALSSFGFLCESWEALKSAQ